MNSENEGGIMNGMREGRCMSLIERLKLGSELKSTLVSRQVIPEIYDTFGKKVGSNRAIAKVYFKIL